MEIDSPAKLPDPGRIAAIEEPIIMAMILTPAEYVGGILQLCQEKRGVQKSLEYLAADRVLVTYELPFNEIVLDFYDRLKTISRGYASLDYQLKRLLGVAAASSSTSWSTATRWTRCRSSSTATGLRARAARSRPRCAS